tara:strand:+ start:51710 stop:52339 length:630 start_codon:yes stop_codon:yes gene_type:complete
MENGNGDTVYDVKRMDELEQVFIDGKIKALDDIYTVEDVSMKIKELDKKIDFLKGYKTSKTKAITAEINTISNKIDFFRQVISKTLTLNKQKNVSFPGSCRVSNVNRKGKWSVLDEESLAEILKEEDKFDEVFDKVVTTVLDKKALSKLLDNWQKSGKLEELDLSACVEKEENKVSVSIKYEELEEEVKEVEIDEVVPSKKDNGDYDSI